MRSDLLRRHRCQQQAEGQRPSKLRSIGCEFPRKGRQEQASAAAPASGGLQGVKKAISGHVHHLNLASPWAVTGM